MQYHKYIRLFWIAVQFLTKIPVKLEKDAEPSELGESLIFFPAVGILIGVILVLLEFLLSFFLPGSLVILIILIVIFLITGGLHIDGLADTSDAIGSGKSGEKGLEVMKKGNTGPAGAAAVIFCILVKYFALTEYSTAELFRILLLFPAIGRMSLTAGCGMFGYKPGGEGIGRTFFEHKTKNSFIVPALYTLILAFLLFGTRGVYIFGFAVITTVILGKYFTKKYGGISGDMLGFINEITECIALIGGVVIL